VATTNNDRKKYLAFVVCVEGRELASRMTGLKAQVVGFKGPSEDLPYETGKIVRNWAQTFECRPERLYHPRTEDEVVQVYPPYSDLFLDRSANDRS
jgi:hypothetical protein